MSQLSKELIKEYLDWANLYFSEVPVRSECDHLLEECYELHEAVIDGHAKEEIAKEVSDVIMLAIWIAYRNDIDFEQAFKDKFEINKKRTWAVDINGLVKHVKVG